MQLQAEETHTGSTSPEAETWMADGSDESVTESVRAARGLRKNVVEILHCELEDFCQLELELGE
jgi:hypothetical protein